MLDLAFWAALYGTDRAHAVPGIHVSVKGRALYYKVSESVYVTQQVSRKVPRVTHSLTCCSTTRPTRTTGWSSSPICCAPSPGWCRPLTSNPDPNLNPALTLTLSLTLPRCRSLTSSSWRTCGTTLRWGGSSRCRSSRTTPTTRTATCRCRRLGRGTTRRAACIVHRTVHRMLDVHLHVCRMSHVTCHMHT